MITRSTVLTCALFILACITPVFAGDIDLTRNSVWANAELYDKYIRSNAPDEDAFVAVQRMAANYIRGHQWDSALIVFERYRPLFPDMKARFDKIKAIIQAPDEKIVVQNLGPGVNSEFGELSPVPTADGKRLYFTSFGRPGGKGREDIYVSDLHDTVWGKAEDIGSGINTDASESVNGISADGNRLVIFGNYDGSLGNGDLFYVDREEHGWSAVKHFPKPINSEDFESAGFLTSDGKALLFSSDRSSSIGKTHYKRDEDPFHGSNWGNQDIYVSLLDEDGKWGDPINLGPTINTPFAERTPLLHPDGKTLYFSSDGHPGLGRLDVFKSTRLKDDSWTEWSEPVNLGKEINSGADEWGYRVATKGDIAFFEAASRKDGFGKGDIYSVTMPKLARPQPVATIHGIVTDPAGHPLEAKIKWENLEARKNAGNLKSNPQDGKYFVALPMGLNYGYFAEKEGYYPVSKNVDLRGVDSSIDRTENIVLITVEQMKATEAPVRLNNIFFEFDKADLKPESYPELDRVAKLFKSSPDAKVEISGHTDNHGADDYNMDLSQRRAQSVITYLASVGCKASNFVAKGYGKTKPVASNDTDEGRATNRRVEFQFLK